MADVTHNVQYDASAVSLTLEKLQRRVLVVESAIVAAADTIVVAPDYANLEEGAVPPNMTIYTHNGGLQYSAAAATLAVNNGDTISFDVWDPTVSPTVQTLQDSIDQGTELKFTRVTHTLAGVTNGAATPAQIAASFTADTTLSRWVYSGVTATNIVCLFPKGPNGKIRTAGGTAAALIAAFPSTLADNSLRTFTHVDALAAAWALTSSVPTSGTNSGRRVLTVTKAGATVAKVAIRFALS